MELPLDMISFLDVEAKKFSEQQSCKITTTDIVRALIASYYEKRIAGLVSCPDD